MMPCRNLFKQRVLIESKTKLLDDLRLESHVWYIHTEAIRDNILLKRLKNFLSTEELERYKKFKYSKDKHQYLVSHALVREVLSKYVAIHPTAWRFICSPYGRPEIANPGVPLLRFNLTHTVGLAACIISLGSDCGIDAEYIVERRNLLAIAQKMFSNVEYEELRQLCGQDVLEYFFSCWTLREAYVKAIGIGITFPTHKLLFKSKGNIVINFEFAQGLDDNSAHWQFSLLRPDCSHILAIALRRGDADKKIITRFLDF